MALDFDEKDTELYKERTEHLVTANDLEEKTAIDKTTQLFSIIIDEQNDPKLNPNKDKIIEWIKTNRKLIPEMDRKSFMKKVAAYCNDNKMKGSLGKVWKKYIEVISSKTEPEPKAAIEFVAEHTEAGSASQAPKEEESNDEITASFSKLIDEKNDDKLNAQKGKILEWIASNQARIPEMDRKSFTKEASAYCEDKKAKSSLGKLWNDYISVISSQTAPNTEPTNPIISASETGRVSQLQEEKEASNEILSANNSYITNREEELKYEPKDEREFEESVSKDSDHDHEEENVPANEQMPTYIHRAIWFRSDDENLERLVDNAVKYVLKQNEWWQDPEFVQHLYDSKKYEQNVEIIANYMFFGLFVKKQFRRELLLDAIHQEEGEKKAKDDHCDDKHPGVSRLSRNLDLPPTHIAYIMSDEHNSTITMDEKKGYHIYQNHDTDDRNAAKKTFQDDQPRSELYLEPDQNKGYDWTVWKNTGQNKEVAKVAAKHNHKTYGYWDILNNDKSIKNNEKGKKPGVPLKHLNIIFELLRDYYRKRIRCINERENQHRNLRYRSPRDPQQFDPLLDHYCSSDKQQKVDIDIYIHDDNNADKHHYKLTWWNCKKRTDCNAIAIKNMNLSQYINPPKQEDIKERYYMRFKTENVNYKHDDEDISKPIIWQWYDNDVSAYKAFLDYKFPDEPQQDYKEGLLHKQLEASYQSNIYANFPWPLFIKFNNAQITHLPIALKSNIGKKVSTHYLLRFTRLSYGGKKDQKTKKQMGLEIRQKQDSRTLQIDQFALNQPVFELDPLEVNMIMSMEQVAVTSDLYPRTVQRLKDGKNSLKAQYSGSEPFVNEWLATYQLSTEAQQKYFWSFILSIATKIKHIDIEIENQLVTIPKGSYRPSKKASMFASTSGEVVQEQQDALLYKGFLVPPVLGEAVTDAIQNNTNTTMKEVRERIEGKSKTRRLQKCKVKEQGLINYDVPDADFVFVHKPNDKEQFLEHQAIMFRFAEIVRKYIIENKHLNNDSSLWPYYRNSSHIDDYDIYHTMVNRFNLSLMFNKQTIFELFETESSDEYIGFFKHLSCCASYSVNKQKYVRKEQDQIAIRHRRKYAATLLLQRWNTLRNLNLLRQQLLVLFNSVDILDDEKKTQEDMVTKADTYIDKWTAEIAGINEKLEKNIKHNKDGWQFLSEYSNLKDNKPIKISIKQYPFFERFCTFLFKKVEEEEKKKPDLRKSNWFQAFTTSWSATPHWWKFKYDLILLELALQHNMNHVKYVQTLKSDKAFDFRMQLKDRTNYLEFTHFCAQQANILHRLAYITNLMIDKLLEIQPSLVEILVPTKQQKGYDQKTDSFIFSDYEKATHEKYVQRKLHEIEDYRPACKKTLENRENKEEYKRYKELLNPIVADFAQDIRKNWPIANDEKEKEQKQSSLKPKKKKKKSKHKLTVNITSQTGAECTEITSLISDHDQDSYTIPIEEEEEEGVLLKHCKEKPDIGRIEIDVLDQDDEDQNEQKEIEIGQKKKKTDDSVDPFISRDLNTELVEVLNAFDMIKYGKHMALFLINEIKEFGIDELWTILGVVMEAIPFQMAESILYSEMESLERGTPTQLEALCLQMVDGTNWRVSAALRVAEYFTKIADDEALDSEAWMKISSNFEDIAHKAVHDIESDHLLYLLLTIPLYDTSAPMNIIKLALEQKRRGFLNNDRILTVIEHIWYHGPSINIEDELKDEALSFTQLLSILVFTPFKFYITPIGYNYTLSILFLLYLLYVLAFSFLVVQEENTFFMEIILWILNAGYILYELSEWCDKGREYFSASGLMNIWDIMISVVWIILFVITIFANPNQSDYLDIDREYLIDNDNVRTILIKAYTILFGFQIFLLSTRFLTLFQNTEYLGGLLKIVQMMSQEIFKFFSVAVVVIAAFSFGFYFIYGIEVGVDDDEAPDGFLDTILFTFELFIDGGTSSDSAISAIFTVFLTIVGSLVLTNLLIALMTTKYENFQEIAQAEVHFMRIQSTIDLAHRDRLMPPPLNVLIYPLGILIHIWLTFGAVLSLCCCSCCNCYSRINRGTYLCLNTCYCGCNKRIQLLNASKRHKTDPQQVDNDEIVQRQLYKLSCLELFLEVSGLRFLANKLIALFWCESCYCDCCKEGRKSNKVTKTKCKYCRKCCRHFYRKCGIRKCCRRFCGKCRIRKLRPESALNAYHKGCYHCVKLRVKDEFGGDHDENQLPQTTVRGITMKEYITTYEEKRGTKLHLVDTILLKHLTVDTLLCSYCYQPYLEEQVSKSLLSPLRVLLDIISCVAFLFTAWIPLILFFTLMAFYEYLRDCCDSSFDSKDADNVNKYEEFDREYFPHPEKMVVKLD